MADPDPPRDRGDREVGGLEQAPRRLDPPLLDVGRRGGAGLATEAAGEVVGLIAARDASASTLRSSSRWSLSLRRTAAIGGDVAGWARNWALNCAWTPGRRTKTTGMAARTPPSRSSSWSPSIATITTVRCVATTSILAGTTACGNDGFLTFRATAAGPRGGPAACRAAPRGGSGARRRPAPPAARRRQGRRRSSPSGRRWGRRTRSHAPQGPCHGIRPPPFPARDRPAVHRRSGLGRGQERAPDDPRQRRGIADTRRAS